MQRKAEWTAPSVVTYFRPIKKRKNYSKTFLEQNIGQHMKLALSSGDNVSETFILFGPNGPNWGGYRECS